MSTEQSRQDNYLVPPNIPTQILVENSPDSVQQRLSKELELMASENEELKKALPNVAPGGFLATVGLSCIVGAIGASFGVAMASQPGGLSPELGGVLGGIAGSSLMGGIIDKMSLSSHEDTLRNVRNWLGNRSNNFRDRVWLMLGVDEQTKVILQQHQKQ